MFIHKYNMRGHQYASVCESYRDPATKQPRRRTVRTLGRVIDFEKMLFRSATLGVFRYDREKDECVPVSSDEIPVIVDRRRGPEKLILHFGEAYIIDRIINRMPIPERRAGTRAASPAFCTRRQIFPARW